MKDKIIETFNIGRTKISFVIMKDGGFPAVSIALDGETDYQSFDDYSDAKNTFELIKNGADPWETIGITNGVPEDWMT